MNIWTLTGSFKKQEVTGLEVISSPIKTCNNRSEGDSRMVTNSVNDKEQRPSSCSNRLNGYTVLQEAPIVSRLIVRSDSFHQGTTENDDSPVDIPSSKTTSTTTTTTTTLYKCHLCCSICPTLHRMRCHLVFHCRKEPLKCLPLKAQSNYQEPDLKSTDAKQEFGASLPLEKQDGKLHHSLTLNRTNRTAHFSSGGVENLSLHKNVHANQTGIKSDSSDCGSSFDPAGVERGASGLVDGSYAKLRSEGMKDTPGMDSCNSAACSDLTSRKRNFSINDDCCNRNSLSAKHIIHVEEKRDCKKFSPDQSCTSDQQFVQKSGKNIFENGGREFAGDSNFKPFFDRDGFERAVLPQSKSPVSDASDACIGDQPNTTYECFLPQNAPPFFSPYYWLARQQWFNLSRYPEISHPGEQARNSISERQTSPSKNHSPPANKQREEITGQQAPFNLLPIPLRPSPTVSSATSSPSKSSTPSADSSSSSPLAPSTFHLYNPLELVKIMRNLSAYPNFLPPLYPFFTMPPNLRSYQPDSTYKPLENKLSDNDETSHKVAYPSMAPGCQPKVPTSLSFDKSLSQNLHPSYYPLFNFSPPSAYNMPQSKFIPTPETGATTSSPCLSSFNQSQFYKSAFSSDSNFHNTSKTWPSPCDVKPASSDPVVRRESKFTTFCKMDKSEAVKSSAKRGEACRPIKLADGRTVYHCSQCRKTFTNISDVNRHMDFHEDIRPFKCKFCSYYARTNSQLKVHMMRHQGIRQYVCNLCNYKGVTQSDLNRHTKSQIHVLKSRNECSQCSEGFVSPMNLAQHCKDRHHSSVT